MPSEERNRNRTELPPELKLLEAAMAKIVPRAVSIDRDRLMFEAGWQAAERSKVSRVRRWAWPTVAAGMTAVSASLLVLMLLRMEPFAAERMVDVAPNPQQFGSVPYPPPDNSSDGQSVRCGPSPKESAAPSTMHGTPIYPSTSADSSYRSFRDRLLGQESETWPPPAGSSAELPPPGVPRSYVDLRKELLGTSADEPAAST